ncbi:MAG TPA: hypothetical protein DEF82_00360 [Crocinitomicaceae bacterium]|nr:hypothetical protein [Flavobacteriales bacterium]HBW85239.1 hypothetical protein [Crocinitomicaceae bacterium]
MLKSISLTVALMTAPFVADAQWIANKKNFKKVNENTRVLKDFSRRRIRSMVTIVLTNNNYILDTMIFNSKSPVPFFYSWETANEVKTMAVVENEKGNYDIYLFHHRREETYYFTVNEQNYGYLP